LTIAESFVFLKTDKEQLSPNKLILLLKCLLILQYLPEAALEEAAENLEEITDFYIGRSPKANLPQASSSTIKGTLKSVQVRPPIVLEP
jgi:hypothetical protein